MSHSGAMVERQVSGAARGQRDLVKPLWGGDTWHYLPRWEMPPRPCPGIRSRAGFPQTGQRALPGPRGCSDFDPGGSGTGGQGRDHSGRKPCVGFFWTLARLHKYAAYVSSFTTHGKCYPALARNVCLRFHQVISTGAANTGLQHRLHCQTALFMMTKPWKPLGGFIWTVPTPRGSSKVASLRSDPYFALYSHHISSKGIFYYVLVSWLPPPGQFHEGRKLCLFYSLLHTQSIKQYEAQRTVACFLHYLMNVHFPV